MNYRMPLFLFFLLASFACHAQSNIKVSQVRSNIYCLVSPTGGNVVVSTGEDGVFVIDDQLTERSEAIDVAIKDVANKEIQFILNTHYHFDHTGGNEFFGGKGSVIVAHDNVRKRLSARQFITYFKKEMQPYPRAALPVVTFADDITFHYNDDEIRVFHISAAHTDGDAAAFFANENVIVTGDTVFNGMYPFIDVEHGGSSRGMIKAAEIFLNISNDDTIIVPGHGGPMNKAELQAYRDALATITDRVEAAVKAGKTLEQTLAARPTREFDAGMDKGIVSAEAFTTLVYQDMTARHKRAVNDASH